MKLENKPIGGSSTDAFYAREGRRIPSLDDRTQFAWRELRQERQGASRPDAGYAKEPGEGVFLFGRQKAVELKRLLAHVHVGEQRHLVARGADSRQRAARDVYFVAHATNVYDDVVAALLFYNAAQTRDVAHCAGTPFGRA